MSLNYWKKIDRQIDRWKLKKRSLAKFSYVQNCLSNFDFAITNNERALERRKIGDRPPSNNLTQTDTLYEKAIDSFTPVDDAERENRQNTIATRSSRVSAILLRKKCEWDEMINSYKNVPFSCMFRFLGNVPENVLRHKINPIRPRHTEIRYGETTAHL